MTRQPGESGGFCQVRGAIFGRRDADLIEAGLNEAAVGLCRDLWGLLSGCGWRGGTEAQGRWDRGERWSSILPEVNGASGGLRPFAAPGGVRRAGPARKGPAAGEGDAVEGHRGLDTGAAQGGSRWNGAVAGWDRSAPRDSVARTRITPPHSGQAGTWPLAREVA